MHERLDDERASRRRMEAHLRASSQEFRQRQSALRTQLEQARARSEHLERENSSLRAQNESLGVRIRAMEDSMTWRLFGPYRRLRSFLGARSKRAGGEEVKPAQKLLK